MYRETTTMADATVRLNLLQSADVKRDGTAEVSLHAVLALDDVTKLRDFTFRQVGDSR
jgi:hypothetical protein